MNYWQSTYSWQGYLHATKQDRLQPEVEDAITKRFLEEHHVTQKDHLTQWFGVGQYDDYGRVEDAQGVFVGHVPEGTGYNETIDYIREHYGMWMMHQFVYDKIMAWGKADGGGADPLMTIARYANLCRIQLFDNPCDMLLGRQFGDEDEMEAHELRVAMITEGIERFRIRRGEDEYEDE